MKTFHTENQKSAHVLYCRSKNEQKSPNQTNQTKIKTFLTVCVLADYILCSSSSCPNKTNKKSLFLTVCVFEDCILCSASSCPTE